MATLTAKYLHAVTRALPQHCRAGVAEGIEASVRTTMAALRSRDPGLDQEAAEYAAVAALGDPARRVPRPPAEHHFVVRPAVFLRVVLVLTAVFVIGVAVSRLWTGLLADQSWQETASDMGWIMLRTSYRVVCILAVAWWLLEVVAHARQARSLGSADWTPEDLPEIDQPGPDLP